ncbi:hypothetical protein COV20_03705 [Candidatus Woesearchaeota archaeon CG10_big_fil_rev_8_21_14_0_10_45_16]|nr:MAG: hypothetical protein COV20_03705 [Candidatus Woesearchaeota archaeon CG10_big_fil_rev_8_21_14_0_10_45_16]
MGGNKPLALFLIVLLLSAPLAFASSPVVSSSGAYCNPITDNCPAGYSCSGPEGSFLTTKCCPQGEEYNPILDTCIGEGIGQYITTAPQKIVSDDSPSEEPQEISAVDEADYTHMCGIHVKEGCDLGDCSDGDYNCDGERDEVCFAHTEICGNGLDDDKDGIPDDGCVSQDNCGQCGDGWINKCDQEECNGLGKCSFDPGFLLIINQCTNAVSECVSQMEICNGVDDDCDNVVDNDCLQSNVEEKVIDEHLCYGWQACAADDCVVEHPDDDEDGDGVVTKVEIRYWSNPLDGEDDPFNRMFQNGCPDYFHPEIDFSRDIMGSISLGPIDVYTLTQVISSPEKASAAFVGKTIGGPHGLISGVWSDAAGIIDLAVGVVKLVFNVGKKSVDNLIECQGDVMCMELKTGYEAVESGQEIVNGLINANYKQIFLDMKNRWFDERSTVARDIWEYEGECENVILTRTYTASYTGGFVAAQILLLLLPVSKVGELGKLKVLTKFKALGDVASKGAKIFDAIGEFAFISKLPEDEAAKVVKLVGKVAEDYGDDVAKALAKSEIGQFAVSNLDENVVEGLAKFAKNSEAESLNKIFNGLSQSDFDVVGTKLNLISKDLGSDGIQKLLAKEGVENVLLKGKPELITKWVEKGKEVVGTDFRVIRPTQDVIDPGKVDQYFNQIIQGEDTLPIEFAIEESMDGVGVKRWILDGHHRFVAYERAGFSFDEMPYIFGEDYNSKVYNSWKDVKFENLGLE